EPVAQLEYSPPPIREVLECLAQGFLLEYLGGTLIRRLRSLVGDQLTKLRLLVVADRHLERDWWSGRALDRIDLFWLDAGRLADLSHAWLSTQLRFELSLRAPALQELVIYVNGNSDRARLVRQRAGQRLADPPGRV